MEPRARLQISEVLALCLKSFGNPHHDGQVSPKIILGYLQFLWRQVRVPYQGRLKEGNVFTTDFVKLTLDQVLPPIQNSDFCYPDLATTKAAMRTATGHGDIGPESKAQAVIFSCDCCLR
jgi:hypothetical protein